MTATQHETPAAELLRALPDLTEAASREVSRQLLDGLDIDRDRRNYLDSIGSRLTETYEEFCDRITAKAATS